MRLRCPSCQTINDVPAKEEAVCRACGFGAKRPNSTGPPAPGAPPQDHVPPPGAGSGPTLGPPVQGHAPPIQGPPIWPPSISPTGAAVASFASFGIYFLVLIWKWAAWRDAWDLRGRALPWARWGTWVTVASAFLVVAAYILFFVFMIGSFVGMDEASGEEPPASFFVGMIAFMGGIMLGFGGLLAGRICLFMAQWRVWSSLQDALAARAAAPKVAPIALLLIEIFGPQVMYFLVFIVMFVVMFGLFGATAAFGAAGAPVAIAVMMVMYLVAAVLVALPILYVIRETQARVLAVSGQASRPPGAHPAAAV